MGDVNWVLYNFGGKGRGAKRERGVVPVLGQLCPKNWVGPRRKLPFELQGTAYPAKQCLAVSLIIS